jgi:hypothetical protein
MNSIGRIGAMDAGAGGDGRFSAANGHANELKVGESSWAWVNIRSLGVGPLAVRGTVGHGGCQRHSRPFVDGGMPVRR